MHTLQCLCTVINAPRRSLQIESNQVKCCEGPREKEQVWRWPLTIKSVTFGNKDRFIPLSCNCVWQMLQSWINVSLRCEMGDCKVCRCICELCVWRCLRFCMFFFVCVRWLNGFNHSIEVVFISEHTGTNYTNCCECSCCKYAMNGVPPVLFLLHISVIFMSLQPCGKKSGG